MPFAKIDISDTEIAAPDAVGPGASYVVNWELDEFGINRQRAPLTTYSVTGLGSSPVIESFRWYNYVILVTADRKLYAINDAAPTNAFAISDSTSATQLEGNKRPVFVGGEQAVYVTGGGRPQYWMPSMATSALLSASAPRCTHIASLGQRLIANDTTQPNVFWWSDIGSGLGELAAYQTWPADNLTAAEARPDPIIGIFENTNELFVFGESTLQVYQVGSDPYLPFDEVATVNTGLLTPYMAIRLDDAFAYLDDKRRLVISDGRSVTPIGTGQLYSLRMLTSVTDAWGYREEAGNRSKLVFRFPTDQLTLVYDLNSGEAPRFVQRKLYTSPVQGDWATSSYSYVPALNIHLMGLTAGGLAKFDPAASSFSELGGPLVCERITGWDDKGVGGRKRCIRVRVTMRRGTAAEGATAGSLEVRKQDDDGAWDEWEFIAVGNPGEYENTIDLFPGGIYRRRRYHVRFSTSEPTALVSMAEEFQEVAA